MPQRSRTSRAQAAQQARQLEIAAPADNPDRLLDIKQVAALMGCSTSMVFRMVREDEFPRPIHVGVLSRWTARTYNQWVAAKRAHQDEPGPRHRRRQHA